MTSILIIDDDVELCAMLEEYLSNEGFSIGIEYSGMKGVSSVLSSEFQLVILDVMMPGMSGIDILREIKARSEIPVIMLTARGEEIDRITGLETGADDYVPKPFNPRELVARIRAVLRRAGATENEAERRARPIIVGDIRLDARSGKAWQNELPITLTSIEFELLWVLLSQAGQAVPREEISFRTLGRPLTPGDRSIDVHVSSLRRKLGTHSNGLDRIRTVRGVGYQYTDPGDEPS